MKYIYTVFMLALALLQADQASAQAVTGAGSSAAAPIYRSWAKAYARATGSRVDYDPVGSSAGMKKIQQQAVGFGATDVYPPDKDLIEHGLLALPVAITGISPIVNLPKVQNAQLRLTGEVLSRIFLGEIRISPGHAQQSRVSHSTDEPGHKGRAALTR